MLRVTLMGNMGADAEVRATPRGTQFTSIRVAVNQVRTGADGERQESTEWFRVRVMGRQQEFVQRLSKGTRVLVVGRLDINHYQSREGEQRTSYDVWADDVQALTPRGLSSEPTFDSDADSTGNGNGNGNGTHARPQPVAAGGRRPPADESPEDLEDLPF